MAWHWLLPGGRRLARLTQRATLSAVHSSRCATEAFLPGERCWKSFLAGGMVEHGVARACCSQDSAARATRVTLRQLLCGRGRGWVGKFWNGMCHAIDRRERVLAENVRARGGPPAGRRFLGRRLPRGAPRGSQAS